MSAKSPPIVWIHPPSSLPNGSDAIPAITSHAWWSASGRPSPDDYASVQAAVLGSSRPCWENAPPATSLYAEVSNRRVVLFANGHELLWTEPLPEQILATLRQRPEILLVWVDIPLANPRRELSAVGIEHVWTGTAPVRGGVT